MHATAVDLGKLRQILVHNYARVGCSMGEIDWMEEKQVLRYKLVYPDGTSDYVHCDVVAFFDKEPNLAEYLLHSTVQPPSVIREVHEGRLDQFAVDMTVYTKLQRPEDLH